MKTILSLFATLAIITGLPFTGHAVTYTVTSNGEAWTTLVGGNSCAACTIDIPAGWTIALGSPNSCAGCTFNGGTLNVSGFSFTGATTFENNTVNIGGNTALALNGGVTFSNSALNLSANATLTTKGLTSSGSTYNMSGNTILTVNNPGSTFSGDNITMTGNASATFNSGMSMTNGSFTTSGNAAVTVNGAFTSSNITLSFSDNSDFHPSSNANITGGSVTVNDKAKLNVSSTITVTGSTVTTNASGAMSGSSIDLENTATKLNDSSTLTASSTLTVGTGSDLTVGNGSGANGPNVSTSSLNVTGASFVGVAGSRDTLSVGSGKFKNDGGGSITIAKTTIGCETLNNSGLTTCIVLAVADISLTATPAGSSTVDLSWNDAANATAAGYQVQRSIGNNPWTTLATVPAEAGANDYRFEDDAAPAGTVEYRIVHVDKDGNESYSAISAVDISGTDTGASAIRIFPNPATGHTFNIATPSAADWIVNVYTITGQLLLRTSLEGQTQYPVRLPSQLPAGTAVVVQVIGRSATQTFTVVLL